MEPAGSRTEHVAALDLIRFACAAMVVAYHYAAAFPTQLPVPAPWTAATWFGFVGVQIFFVVSGYVIACSAAHGGGRAFLRRRVLRLAPAAWVCATATALVVVASGHAQAVRLLPEWIASMTFWPVAPQIDDSYWTLGIELSFYLLVAVLLNGRSNERAIERVGAGLALASAAHWLYVGIDHPQLNRGIDLLLLSHGGFFAIGIALYAVRERGHSPLRLATLAIGLAAGAAEIITTSNDMAGGMGIVSHRWAPLAVFGTALAIIAAADHLQRPLVRIFGAWRLAAMGLATYPLYLIHQRVGEIVIITLHRAGMDVRVAIGVAAALSLLLAAFVVQVMEPRVRAALARRWPATPRRDLAPDTPPTASLPAG